MNRFWSPTLGDVTEPVSTWNPLRDGKEAFRYVELSAVDQGVKAITDAALVEPQDAPSRARQIVRTDDILVSTVRPNLNAVARVTKELDGATASTGFCVLRPTPGKVDPAYLFHWVRTPRFVDEMVRNATGASYPAVSERIVKASVFPLPPLDDQRRIAAILDKADALRQKRKRAIALLDRLTQSIFLEMFGSPDPTWPTTTIDEVSTSIRTGPFGSQLLHSEFVDEGIAVLGIDNVVQNRFLWGKPRFVTPKKYATLRRYKVHPGDILITIMGTIGRCAVVPDDIGEAINTKHLCCITVDGRQLIPDYLKSAFLWHADVLRQLGSQSKGAIMDGLNMGIIKALRISVPPMTVQREFARVAAAIATATESAQKAQAAYEALFSSLQHRAFSGQL